MDMNATLDLAKLLISPESNLKEIDAFEDAAHAIACGYITQSAELTKAQEQLRVAVEALEEVQGCFHASDDEGIADRMSEQENKEDSSLYGLVNRRLRPAYDATCTALRQIAAMDNNNEKNG